MADPAVKLTKAQREALTDVGFGGFRSADTYAPIKRLLELGLVAKGRSSFGASSFKLTASGRALLDALKDEGEGR